MMLQGQFLLAPPVVLIPARRMHLRRKTETRKPSSRVDQYRGVLQYGYYPRTYCVV